MADQDEKGWYDQAGDWVEQQYQQVTGGDAAADQQPVAVRYEEPTQEQKDAWRHEADLGEYITSVCGALQLDVAAAEQQASILHSTADSSTREEFEALAA